MPLAARVALEAPPETVHAFLADLGNHWRLTGRHVRLDRLDGNDGGQVRLRGPAGIGRTVRTRVVASDPPNSITGEATLGRRTRACITWSIARDGRGSVVTLAAQVESLDPLDRLALACGGRLWLRRMLRRTVARLPAVLGTR